MIHMHNLEGTVSVFGRGLLQFPHPRIMLSRGFRPLPLQDVLTPITPFKPGEKGFVAGNRKPLLPGLTFKQQIDRAFRLLFGGLVVLCNVLFQQVLDALTEAWHPIALAALLGNVWYAALLAARCFGN